MPLFGRKKAATQKGAAEHASASATEHPQNSQATITSAVAADPSLPPTLAAAKLFPSPRAYKRGFLRFKIKEQLEEGRGGHWNWHNGATHHGNREPDDEELEEVRKRYGYKTEAEGGPSKLYLMILADALLPLPRNPMSGVVSPPLLATTGIVPCSIFSTGPDIIEHYCDCIIAAKREVILLTNYWQGGKNVDRIADALRELNRRVQERRDKSQTQEKQVPSGTVTTEVPASEKIVVKLMWDRGPQTLADLFRCRKPVPPGMWKSNGLPTENDVPNLDIEILNYHRPLMGTFHAKLLLVDRQVALINSNNIQDRPNVEACTRLEGDIVNSIYDHALISWGNALNPPLPCLGTPAPKEPSPSAFVQGAEGNLPEMSAERLRALADQARRRLQEEDEETEEEKQHGRMPGPTRRLSIADVVEGMMERGGLHGQRKATAADGDGQHDAEGMSSVDAHKAARHAGVTWAQKVLGGQGHQSGSGTQPAAAEGSPGTPAAANAGGGSGDRPHAKGSVTPTDSSQPQSRRHFADVVDAMMKKEGIKPGLWAEGALDTLGLGPSSSRNVDDEVRKSREQRRRDPSHAAASRGISIPRSVAEEDGQDGSARSQTIVGDQDGENDAAFKGAAESTATFGNGNSGHVDKEAEDAATSECSEGQPGEQPNGHALRAAAEAEAAEKGKGGHSEKMSDKLVVPDATEGAPGSVGYRTKHRRTLSNLSKTSASQRLAQITKSLDFANLSQVKGEIKADELSKFSKSAATAAGQDTEKPGPAHDAALAAFAQGASDVLDFRPYTFHAPHDPVPMALMNRRPHGTPGHSDIRNPQDAAWLAGFRYAKKHIFIQSPTLNASPIKAAVLAAVRRQVRVELWLDLGFNDKSESMPFQGGTNEQVVTRLYRQLRREGKGHEKYLEVYWYTGKDMTRPLNAVRKQRNCHVKYAAFDGQVAILGSGNQDTQSWFHSQEINVCVDSAQIVAEWDKALRRNQSTGLYGRVDDDGIWRGRSGAETADDGK